MPFSEMCHDRYSCALLNALQLSEILTIFFDDLPTYRLVPIASRFFVIAWNALLQEPDKADVLILSSALDSADARQSKFIRRKGTSCTYRKRESCKIV